MTHRVETDESIIVCMGSRQDCIDYILAHGNPDNLNLVNGTTGRVESWIR